MVNKDKFAIYVSDLHLTLHSDNELTQNKVGALSRFANDLGAVVCSAGDDLEQIVQVQDPKTKKVNFKGTYHDLMGAANYKSQLLQSKDPKAKEEIKKIEEYESQLYDLGKKQFEEFDNLIGQLFPNGFVKTYGNHEQHYGTNFKNIKILDNNTLEFNGLKISGVNHIQNGMSKVGKNQPHVAEDLPSLDSMLDSDIFISHEGGKGFGYADNYDQSIDDYLSKTNATTICGHIHSNKVEQRKNGALSIRTPVDTQKGNEKKVFYVSRFTPTEETIYEVNLNKLIKYYSNAA